VPGEQLAQDARPPGVDGAPGRILPARSGDDGVRAAAKGGFEFVGDEAALVDAYRLGPQSEGLDQVVDARPAGVLHHHLVSRAEPGLQHALDGVECAARYGDVAVDPVGGEVRPGQLGEPVQLDGTAVELAPGIEAGQRRLERRQQGRVRVTGGKVAGTGGQRPGAPQAQRRLAGYHGAEAGVAADQPAPAEGAVGGRDRGRAHPQLGGQIPDSREPLRRGETPVRDRGLDPRGDGSRARARSYMLFQIKHRIVL
jgi:hypothetical protein